MKYIEKYSLFEEDKPGDSPGDWSEKFGWDQAPILSSEILNDKNYLIYHLEYTSNYKGFTKERLVKLLATEKIKDPYINDEWGISNTVYIAFSGIGRRL